MFLDNPILPDLNFSEDDKDPFSYLSCSKNLISSTFAQNSTPFLNPFAPPKIGITPGISSGTPKNLEKITPQKARKRKQTRKEKMLDNRLRSRQTRARKKSYIHSLEKKIENLQQENDSLRQQLMLFQK